MTIETIIHDGISTKHRVWRKIYRTINYDQLLNGFKSYEKFCKWGEMWQLKGDKRILLATFGGRHE